MYEVKIYDLGPMEIIKIVHDIKESGFTMGIDFLFSYNPGSSYYNENGEYVVGRKCTYFTFVDEGKAAWFTLKYT